MYTILCTIAISFFGCFPKEAYEAISLINENKQMIQQTMCNISSEEQLIAISIVAPEISQFSKYLDFVELRTLYVIYLSRGKSDFSIGPFQMKPSFIEEMEKIVINTPQLIKKYKDLIPKGSDKEKRKFRLQNLSSYKGQLK